MNLERIIKEAVREVLSEDDEKVYDEIKRLPTFSKSDAISFVYEEPELIEMGLLDDVPEDKREEEIRKHKEMHDFIESKITSDNVYYANSEDEESILDFDLAEEIKESGTIKKIKEFSFINGEALYTYYFGKIKDLNILFMDAFDVTGYQGFSISQVIAW